MCIAPGNGECLLTQISRNVESRAVGPKGRVHNRLRLSRHTPTVEVGASTPRCSRPGTEFHQLCEQLRSVDVPSRKPEEPLLSFVQHAASLWGTIGMRLAPQGIERCDVVAALDIRVAQPLDAAQGPAEDGPGAVEAEGRVDEFLGDPPPDLQPLEVRGG